MKKIMFILIITAICWLLSAQEIAPWQFIRHSSRMENGQVVFRFNTTDGEFSQNEFYHYTDANGWVAADTQNIGEMVFECQMPYSFGQATRYRLRSEMEYMEESFVTMHTSHYDSDAFPPVFNSMAKIADDPQGDTEVINANMLDLTGTYIASSQQKLYSTLQNVQGSFPVMNSLTSYNLYMTIIGNPESAVGDSVMYAMLYTQSIPGVISTGLYKVGTDADMNPTFEQIGNIQSQVSGGRLNMACNIADLVNDPSFGEWPNMSNSLLFSSMTVRINIDLGTMEPEFLFGDYSSPAMIVFENLVHQVSQNTLPVLSQVQLEYEVSGIQIMVEYTDQNSDFPLRSKLVTTDRTEYEMVPASLDYSAPVVFTTLVPAAVSLEGAYISFSDNNIEFIEQEVSPTAVEDAQMPVAELRCVLPNPVRASRSSIPITMTGLKNGSVCLDVYNLKGQKLGRIADQDVQAGRATLIWNGRVDGSQLPSGVHFLRITQQDRVQTAKFMVIQ